MVSSGHNALTQQPLVLHIYLMTWVIIGLDNGLSLLGDKPLSKPVLTSHQSHPKEQTCNEKKNQWNYAFFIDKVANKVIIYNLPPFCPVGDELRIIKHI